LEATLMSLVKSMKTAGIATTAGAQARITSISIRAEFQGLRRPPTGIREGVLTCDDARG
jgi:hypothetical protein